jgi:hypothetical protein
MSAKAPTPAHVLDGITEAEARLRRIRMAAWYGLQGVPIRKVAR